MTDATTPFYGWAYPTVNADADTWGTTLNAAVAAIDSTLKTVTDAFQGHNCLINGNFQVNQRVVSGTVTLAAGKYGHDGWFAGASGCTYTFAFSGDDTTLTISAGSLVQKVRGENVPSAAYMLSQAGTANARVYQGWPSGSFVACPQAVTGLTPGNNTFVEFTTGTVSLAQFEPGPTVTKFERVDFQTMLARCTRICRKSYDYATAPGTNTITGLIGAQASAADSGDRAFILSPAFGPPMASDPTVTLWTQTGTQGSVAGYSSNTAFTATLHGTSEKTLGLYLQLGSTPGTFETLAFHYLAEVA